MDWATLLRQVDNSFSDDELRTLCFELAMDYDNLAGDTKKAKARELIAALQRRGRVDELIQKLMEMRPQLDWQRPSPAKQSGLDEAQPAQNNQRRRPAMGGDSISHYRAGAATLACLVVDRQPPHHRYLLCELSGLRLSGRPLRAGDPIIQPGQADGGSLSQDIIASLSRWGTIKDDPLAAQENIAAGLAQIHQPVDVSPEIRGRGFLKGVRPVAVGTAVTGVGRTSGEVSGTVRQLDATIELMLPADLVAGVDGSGNEIEELPILFAGLIRCTFMLHPGDGGMLLVDEDNYALGLGFAGNDKESYFIPIQNVLDALAVDLVTEARWQALTEPDETVATDVDPAVTPPPEKPATTRISPATVDLSHIQSQLADLRRQLKRNRLVLFVGADFPQSVTGLPSRAELAAQLAQRKGLAAGQALTAVAQAVMADGSRWEFTDFLRERTDTVGKQPRAIHQAIVALVKAFGIETIITTTYDDMLDFAFRQAGQGVDVVVREGDLAFVNPDRPTLIRLFGHSRQPDTLAVTEQDHNAILRGRLKRDLVAEIEHVLRRNTVLYLGHDLRDTTVSALMDELSHDRSPRSYAVWSELSPAEADFFRSQRNVAVLAVDPLSLLQTLPEE